MVDFEKGCGQLSISEILIQQWVSGSDDLYMPKIPLMQTLCIRKFPFVDRDHQITPPVNNQQTLEKEQDLNSSITN